MLPCRNDTEGTEYEHWDEPIEVLAIFLGKEVENEHRSHDVTTGKNADRAIHRNHFAVDEPTVFRKLWSCHFRGKENPNRRDRPVGDDKRNDVAHKTLLLANQEDSERRNPEKGKIREREDG